MHTPSRVEAHLLFLSHHRASKRGSQPLPHSILKTSGASALCSFILHITCTHHLTRRPGLADRKPAAPEAPRQTGTRSNNLARRGGATGIGGGMLAGGAVVGAAQKKRKLSVEERLAGAARSPLSSASLQRRTPPTPNQARARGSASSSSPPSSSPSAAATPSRFSGYNQQRGRGEEGEHPPIELYPALISCRDNITALHTSLGE